MTHTHTWNIRKIRFPKNPNFQKINTTLKLSLKIFKNIDSECEIEFEIGIFEDFKCECVLGNSQSYSNSKLDFCKLENTYL
jgi:hypothetical protein